jgi:hypothetical protein
MLAHCYSLSARIKASRKRVNTTLSHYLFCRMNDLLRVLCGTSAIPTELQERLIVTCQLDESETP